MFIIIFIKTIIGYLYFKYIKYVENFQPAKIWKIFI